MSDLISRQDAIDAVTRAIWHYPNECYKNLNVYEVAEALVSDAIKSLPSAEPETGKWSCDEYALYHCSECGCEATWDYDYCHNCGSFNGGRGRITDNERKKSISALRQLPAMCDFADQYGDSIDADPYFNAVETAIESLNKTRWIPVSERLPEKDDPVLATVWNDVVIAWRNRYGKWESAEDMYEKGDVTAWMPRPEPYREDGEA